MLKVGGRMKLSLKAVILVRLTNLRSVYMLLASPVLWTVMSEIFHTNWTQINEILLFSVENKLIFWLVYWRPIGRDIFLSDKNVRMFVQSLKFRMIWVINLLLIYLFCLPNHTWSDIYICIDIPWCYRDKTMKKKLEEVINPHQKWLHPCSNTLYKIHIFRHRFQVVFLCKFESLKRVWRDSPVNSISSSCVLAVLGLKCTVYRNENGRFIQIRQSCAEWTVILAKLDGHGSKWTVIIVPVSPLWIVHFYFKRPFTFGLQEF